MLIAAAALFGGQGANAQAAKSAASPPTKASYKRDVPAALAKQANITEADAVAAAKKVLPNSKIDALELEKENGHLIYSFDFKTAGKNGIDEVNIDALTGLQVGKVSHESPATEKKEAAAEKKAATPKKP